MRWWLALFAMLSAVPAQAQNPDRLDLAAVFLAHCEKPTDDWTALCIGFVEGLQDMLDTAKFVWKVEPPAPECTPGSVTVGQRQSILLRYLRGSESGRKMNTATAYHFALAEAFPCMTRSAPRALPPADKRL
jgi:Rap1a immunity proteins